MALPLVSNGLAFIFFTFFCGVWDSPALFRGSFFGAGGVGYDNRRLIECRWRSTFDDIVHDIPIFERRMFQQPGAQVDPEMMHQLTRGALLFGAALAIIGPLLIILQRSMIKI